MHDARFVPSSWLQPCEGLILSFVISKSNSHSSDGTPTPIALSVCKVSYFFAHNISLLFFFDICPAFFLQFLFALPSFFCRLHPQSRLILCELHPPHIRCIPLPPPVMSRLILCELHPPHILCIPLLLPMMSRLFYADYIRGNIPPAESMKHLVVTMILCSLSYFYPILQDEYHYLL